MIAGGLLVWQRPWQSPLDDNARAVPGVSYPADSDRILRAQLDAMTDAATLEEFQDAAAPGVKPREQAWAQQVWQARTAVRVDVQEWSYIKGGYAADAADGTSAVRVKVVWRPKAGSLLKSPDATFTSQVDLRARPTAQNRFVFTAATPVASARLPVWLAGPLTVTSLPNDGAVVSIGSGLGDVDLVTQARAAVKQVRRVVTGATKAPFLLVVPQTLQQSAHLLGQTPAHIRNIAAVTTTVDQSRDAARLVVVNPELFASMDPRAQQVVVTHEATHLMTETVGSKAPTWVVEGFADFVALHDDRAPLGVSAGQILRQVRDSGAPKHFPEQADFEAAAHGLGAVYESAWMIFKMLSQNYPDSDIVDFYQAVLKGAPVATATERHFGVSVEALRDQWRNYLTNSASTVS